MKKLIIISLVIAFGSATAFAQEPVKQEKVKKERENKDFSEILPHAGDFALGIDLANFIKSINNSITNANAANTVVAFQNDFFGKYFLTDRSALRVLLGIGIHNVRNRDFVRDDVANLTNPLGNNPLVEIKTVDVHKDRNTTLELGIGYEYRRNLWRVQGYAGAEVFGGVTLHKDILEYGNPMTSTNQTPTSTSIDWTKDIYRPLESVGGNTMTLGAAIFAGADIFICRNLSLGAEFNLAGRYNRIGEKSMQVETWLLQQAYTANVLDKHKPVTSSFNLIPSGRLNLSVYF
jgi:hypothetical protein